MDELDKEVIEYFTQIGSMQGMDEAMTKIFATIYISPGEITMEDLARKTKYSLASISNKLRLLEQAGIICKSTKPGNKRVYLHMEKNFNAIMKRQLIKKEQFIINTAKERIPEIIKKYKAKTKTDEDKEKIKILEDYNKQILKAEKIIPRILQIMDEQ